MPTKVGGFKNQFVKQGSSLKKVTVGTNEVRGGKDGIVGSDVPDFTIGNDPAARFNPSTTPDWGGQAGGGGGGRGFSATSRPHRGTHATTRKGHAAH